jgi:hypothetical protein
MHAEGITDPANHHGETVLLQGSGGHLRSSCGLTKDPKSTKARAQRQQSHCEW